MHTRKPRTQPYSVECGEEVICLKLVIIMVIDIHMHNPFDQTFFKFLLGFSFILVVSFALLFFVGKYASLLNGQEASVIMGITNKNK